MFSASKGAVIIYDLALAIRLGSAMTLVCVTTLARYVGILGNAMHRLIVLMMDMCV